MSTNKEAYQKAIIKGLSNNYKTVFRFYGDRSLTQLEYEKMYRYLKPLYTYIDGNYMIFKYPKQHKEALLLR